MVIGVVAERAPAENRVGLTPAGAREFVRAGHAVVVETGAGRASRFGDDEYRDAGARLVYGPEEVFGRADLVLKVAPLTPKEVRFLGEGQTVLAFHHLAAARRDHLDALLARGVTLIGYEMIEDARGDLPILHAMSEIAGQLAIQVAAHFLATRAGGRGVLLGGATGIPPAHVVILGAGVVGLWAARTAIGNGAQVTILDTNAAALRNAEEVLDRRVITEIAHPAAVARAVAFADVLVGSVLVRGERAPILVTRAMVGSMKPGSVVLDVSIDQGGCVETSRPTTLDDPIYTEADVTHYAVPNMASAVARTASLALTWATLPYAEQLAAIGLEAALRECPGLAAGVYLYRGDLVSESAARAFGLRAKDLAEVVRGRDAGALASEAR